jgi:hypothetical protein
MTSDCRSAYLSHVVTHLLVVSVEESLHLARSFLDLFVFEVLH